MRTRHRREDLVRLLEQRTQEHLTFKELSARSGIPIPTLAYWACKLRREQLEHDPGPTLVPVDITDDPARGTITIEVDGRVRIHVEPGFDPGHMARLLSVLRPRC